MADESGRHPVGMLRVWRCRPLTIGPACVPMFPNVIDNDGEPNEPEYPSCFDTELPRWRLRAMTAADYLEDRTMSTFTTAVTDFTTAAENDAPDTEAKFYAMVAAACQPPTVGAAPDETELTEAKKALVEAIADSKPKSKAKPKTAAVGGPWDWKAMLRLVAPFLLQLFDNWLNPATP